MNPFKAFGNLWCFLVFFCLCYFLETITFTYMVSVVQSIERQFEIPSRKSGSLVAASDIGYVVTVVVLAYLGSRGNRSRWIGGGCLLIAIACLIIALPKFVYKTEKVIYNTDRLLKDLVMQPDGKVVLVTEEMMKNSKTMMDDMEMHAKQMFGEKGPLNSRSKRSDMSNRDAMAVWTNSPDGLNEDNSGDVADPLSDDMSEDPGDSLMLETAADVIGAYERRKDNSPALIGRAHFYRNITPEISNKIITSAILPFGICRNATMIVKQRMHVVKCLAQKNDTSNKGAFAMVFIGIMLIGVGHSMPWTLGMPMIDDHVKKRSTPFYFAGVFFVRIMGPVTGFLLGAVCTQLYVTLDAAPAGITSLDPRWIGAWWLGFLVIFAVLTIPSLILMAIPKFETEESKKQQVKNRAASEMRNGQKSLMEGGQKTYHPDDEASVVQGVRGFASAVVQVLKSPIYTGALLGRLFDAFAFKGYFVFKPKYLENHYGLTQFESALYMGILGVVGFAGGVVLGSILMRKARLEGRKAAAYVGICSLITAILSFVQIFLGCHSVVNQIGQIGMDQGNASFPYWRPCEGCNCDAAGLYPVCSQNGTPFYSPCHAGCADAALEGAKFSAKFRFSNCSCVGEAFQEVSRDWCKDNCKTPLIIYFLISTISGVIGGSSVIPGVLIVLRAVKKHHRSVALGFSGFFVSLISTFPSPPIYGLIIDTACVMWNIACDGKPGSCQIYDPKMLRERMYLFHGILRLCALLFDVWVWFHAKGLKLMEEDEEESVPDGQRPQQQPQRPDIPRGELTNRKDSSTHPPPYRQEFGDQMQIEIRGLQLEGEMSVDPKTEI